jgi:rod shape-determining protein MreC
MALYRRTRSTRLLVVSLVMLSLLTITVDYRGGQTGPFATAGRSALSVIGPLQAAVSRVFRPIGNFFNGLIHVGSLNSENDRLRAEIEALRAASVENASIRREYEQLVALFELQEDLRLDGAAARVVGESVSNFEWSVTVNRGSANGVAVDMPVVSGEGLVGHVTQVSSNWSKVQLIIDPNSAVAGKLVGSGETGLVEGRTDGRDLAMELVDEGAEVTPGEQVVTSGYQGGLYPPRVLIGVVSHVSTEPGTLSKLVEIRPAVDFSSLDFVLVVTSHRPVNAE